MRKRGLPLPDVFRKIIDEGGELVIINLEGVKEFNSNGLGLLLDIFTLIKKRGKKCRIAKPSKRVNEVFILTKLVGVIPTFETIDEALRH